MKYGYVVIALATSLGACVGAQVDVKSLAAAPRAMAPRDTRTLRVYDARPNGAVAVYDIDAYGDKKEVLDATVRQKAASLGCDGILLLARKDAIHADNDATTGQLNEHHKRAGSHVDALCIVLPADAAPPAAQ